MNGNGYRFLDPAALARVRSLSLAARGVVEGFITGLHSSPFRGYSVEFAEHRNYSPGDNLRHLDWRMLARTDRLYVKQYEEETNLRVQIVLDTSRSMLYRHGNALSKLEYGAYLTAVLGYLMTRQQDAVGLTTFDEQVRCDIPAHASIRHFGEMMRQLETQCDRARDRSARPAGPTQVADTMHLLADRFQRRRLVVLISDLYDESESVFNALHHLRHRRHEVIVFHLLDAAEVEFPFRETVQFVDLETGEELQVDPSYARDEYRQQLTEFVEQYRRQCNDCQVDYILTQTSIPYDIMLSRYLARRSSL